MNGIFSNSSQLVFIGLWWGFSVLSCNFLLLIAKFMAESGCSNVKNWAELNDLERGHVCVYLELVTNSWEKERDTEAFVFPRCSAPRGSAQPGLGGEEPCSGGDPAVPGSAAAGCERGARGRWRCLAPRQRLLRSFAPTLLPHGRHFRVLSAVAAPRGALPSRPVRAVCVFRKRFLSRALKASPRNNSLPLTPASRLCLL